jgi:hypothetical protein
VDLLPFGVFCLNQPPLLPCASTDLIERSFTAARSRHSGGVFVATGDGAARIVSNDVDLAVWRAMGSIASADDF